MCWIHLVSSYLSVHSSVHLLSQPCISALPSGTTVLPKEYPPSVTIFGREAFVGFSENAILPSFPIGSLKEQKLLVWVIFSCHFENIIPQSSGFYYYCWKVCYYFNFVATLSFLFGYFLRSSLCSFTMSFVSKYAFKFIHTAWKNMLFIQWFTSIINSEQFLAFYQSEYCISLFYDSEIPIKVY